MHSASNSCMHESGFLVQSIQSSGPAQAQPACKIQSCRYINKTYDYTACTGTSFCGCGVCHNYEAVEYIHKGPIAEFLFAVRGLLRSSGSGSASGGLLQKFGEQGAYYRSPIRKGGLLRISLENMSRWDDVGIDTCINTNVSHLRRLGSPAESTATT